MFLEALSYIGHESLPSEAVTQRCSVKKVFLKISQNSQENTCARVSLIMLQEPPVTLLKKRLWHMCFPANYAKFLRTPFLTEHLWWLLLYHFMIILLLFSSFATWLGVCSDRRNCRRCSLKKAALKNWAIFTGNLRNF